MLRTCKSGPRFLSLIIVALLGFVSIIGTDGDGGGGTPAPPPQQNPAPPAPLPPGTPPAGVLNPTQFGTPGWDAGRAVAIDVAGNVFVAGNVSGALDGNTSAGGVDVVLIKYRADGTREWTRQIGTPAVDQVRGVATDIAGNIFMVGDSSGAGVSIAVVAKYDTSGNLLWLFEFASPQSSAASGVAVDAAGNPYVVGAILTEAGSDALIFKLDTNGNLVWERRISTPLEDWASAIAVDSVGNAYVAGATEGAIVETPDQGHWPDFLLAKYDSIGNQIWLQQLGSWQYESWTSVALDNAGGVYVAGHISSQFETGADIRIDKFDVNGVHLWNTGQAGAGYESANGITADATGAFVAGTMGDDAFLMRVDAAGNIQWTKTFGTPAADMGYGIAARSGEIYVVGSTRGAFPGFVNAGDYDGFLAHFGPDGNLR